MKLHNQISEFRVRFSSTSFILKMTLSDISEICVVVDRALCDSWGRGFIKK